MITDTDDRAKHREHLQRRLVESQVPEPLHEGLVEYIVARRPMGHFLTAVLSNDLKDACARADDVGRSRLFEIVFFLYNYAPGQSWGSPEKVIAWLMDPEPTPQVFE